MGSDLEALGYPSPHQPQQVCWPPPYTALCHLQQVPPCGIELGHDVHQGSCGWVHWVGLWGGQGESDQGCRSMETARARHSGGTTHDPRHLAPPAPPRPITPYSLAAWSWRATAPRLACPGVCPRGQGPLRWRKRVRGSLPGKGRFCLRTPTPALLTPSPSSRHKQTPSPRHPHAQPQLCAVLADQILDSHD